MHTLFLQPMNLRPEQYISYIVHLFLYKGRQYVPSMYSNMTDLIFAIHFDKYCCTPNNIRFCALFCYFTKIRHNSYFANYLHTLVVFLKHSKCTKYCQYTFLSSSHIKKGLQKKYLKILKSNLFLFDQVGYMYIFFFKTFPMQVEILQTYLRIKNPETVKMIKTHNFLFKTKLFMFAEIILRIAPNHKC